MGEYVELDETVAVQSAVVGCCYAQRKRWDKSAWEKRRLKLKHNNSEKQNGMEIAHNHDCKPGINIDPFSFCYSPYYWDAIRRLVKKYPGNPAYVNGYYIEKEIQENERASMDAPPCVLAALDSWFEYSDIQISNIYTGLMLTMLDIRFNMERLIKRVCKAALPVVTAKMSSVSAEIYSPPSYEKRIKDIDGPEMQEKKEECIALLKARESIINFLENRNGFISQIENYWSEVQLMGDGWMQELNKMEQLLADSLDEWEEIVERIELDTSDAAYKEFRDGFTELLDNLTAFGREMEEWEKDADEKKNYALLTTSFLICKCGGKIELLTSGQANVLYCNKLLVKLIKLMTDASNYLQGLLDQKVCFYSDIEKSDAAVKSAKRTVLSMISSFENNSSFLVDEKTKGVEIRFFTKGFNDEQEKKKSAFVGMAVFTPISIAASAAGTLVGAGASVGILAYDVIPMLFGNNEEQAAETGIIEDQEDMGDCVVVFNDLTSFWSGASSVALESVKSADKAMKMLTGVGNATVVIAFAASMTGLFFTSDEDWVEAVEVTVYTEDLVFIIRQEYTKNAEEKAPFDGRTGMKILSRVDYTSSSLKMVNWDELKGVNVGFNDEESEGNSVNSTDDILEPMQNEINGDIKK